MPMKAKTVIKKGFRLMVCIIGTDLFLFKTVNKFVRIPRDTFCFINGSICIIKTSEFALWNSILERRDK